MTACRPMPWPITGNLTVTGQTAAGYVAVTDVSTTAPGTSTINFPLADTRANGITAPLGTGGDAGALWFVFGPGRGKGTQLILRPDRLLQVRQRLRRRSPEHLARSSG